LPKEPLKELGKFGKKFFWWGPTNPPKGNGFKLKWEPLENGLPKISGPIPTLEFQVPIIWKKKKEGKFQPTKLGT